MYLGFLSGMLWVMPRHVLILLDFADVMDVLDEDVLLLDYDEEGLELDEPQRAHHCHMVLHELMATWLNVPSLPFQVFQVTVTHGTAFALVPSAACSMLDMRHITAPS